jgi:hypothetical protein
VPFEGTASADCATAAFGGSLVPPQAAGSVILVVAFLAPPPRVDDLDGRGINA